MDFRLTEDQRALQETARRFAQEELKELADELEAKDEPVPPAVRQRYASMGFLGINMPEAYGGLGLGHLDALIVLEEVAKVSPAVAFPIFEACVGPVRTVVEFGSDALKDQVLPSVIAGDMVVAVAMSEPDAGSALTDLKTRARVEKVVAGTIE